MIQNFSLPPSSVFQIRNNHRHRDVPRECGFDTRGVEASMDGWMVVERIGQTQQMDEESVRSPFLLLWYFSNDSFDSSPEHIHDNLNLTRISIPDQERKRKTQVFLLPLSIPWPPDLGGWGWLPPINSSAQSSSRPAATMLS